MCRSVSIMVVSLNKIMVKCKIQLEFFYSVFLASMPGLYRKKCKACQHDNHFNSKKCGCVLDIQSPGRPRGTTASDGYGVSVV